MVSVIYWNIAIWHVANIEVDQSWTSYYTLKIEIKIKIKIKIKLKIKIEIKKGRDIERCWQDLLCK